MLFFHIILIKFILVSNLRASQQAEEPAKHEANIKA